MSGGDNARNVRLCLANGCHYHLQPSYLCSLLSIKFAIFVWTYPWRRRSFPPKPPTWPYKETKWNCHNTSLSLGYYLNISFSLSDVTSSYLYGLRSAAPVVSFWRSIGTGFKLFSGNKIPISTYSLGKGWAGVLPWVQYFSYCAALLWSTDAKSVWASSFVGANIRRCDSVCQSWPLC